MSGILFYVKTPEPAWDQYFDNTDWTPGPNPPCGTWNAGGWWDAHYEPVSDYFVRLTPTGGWEVDYRPTKVRCTWTGGVSTMRILIRDDNNQYIANSGYILSSGDEVTINFTTYDIQWMNVGNTDSQDFDITNIEFLP